MRVLITNDDGIHSKGLHVVESLARELFEEVWVVAPEAERSGASHSVTGNTPLKVKQIADRRFVVNGTPADCVILALGEIMGSENKPDLVLSGINCGKNTGGYITYSGTVGAATEAYLSGVSAIAFSQAYDQRSDISWDVAEELCREFLQKFDFSTWKGKMFLNVTFPTKAPAKGFVVAKQGKHLSHCSIIKRSDPKGGNYYWLNALHDNIIPNQEGTDINLILEGYVTVTPLRSDYTDYESLDYLKEKLQKFD